MYHTKHIFPSYTRLEHFADTCVHVAGLVFSVAATVFLLAAALRPLPAADIAGLIVYCIGLMGMFAASAAYNLVSHHEIKEILRRLDHSAIFVMIAGSYTPFAIVVGGAAGGFMLRQSGPSPLSAWASASPSAALRQALRSCFISPKAGSWPGHRTGGGIAAKPSPMAAGHRRHRLYGGRAIPPHGVDALP